MALIELPSVVTGKIDGPIFGFAMNSGEAGDKATVIRAGFCSSYHGDMFHGFMEQISNLFLIPALKKAVPEAVNSYQSFSNFVIVTKPDSTFELYARDLSFEAVMLPKRDTKAGDAIMRNDIADIREIKFPDIRPQDTDGIIVFTSQNWAHGLQFDFRDPRNPTDKLDMNRFQRNLAKHFLELMFARCFRQDSANRAIRDAGWFPFLAILGDKYDRLYDKFHNESEYPKKFKAILDHFDRSTIEAMSGYWLRRDIFKHHKEFIDSAINSYFEKNYVACVSVLYPRIEGILRHFYLPSARRPNISALLSRLREFVSQKVDSSSLLLYNQFIEYLNDTFFRGFDLSTGEIALSRHSAGHGVAPADVFTQEKALIGFLILDQLFYYLEPENEGKR